MELEPVHSFQSTPPHQAPSNLRCIHLLLCLLLARHYNSARDKEDERQASWGVVALRCVMSILNAEGGLLGV